MEGTGGGHGGHEAGVGEFEILFGILFVLCVPDATQNFRDKLRIVESCGGRSPICEVSMLMLFSATFV